MATAEIEAAIKLIPAKKESLQKALEALRSCSSSFASFTLEWKDLDDHFSAIERSIQERFKDLRDKEAQRSAGASSPPPAGVKEPEATPRPELKTPCVGMDARGLRSFLSEKRKDFSAIWNELTPALRVAPDPAKLVLDVVEGFYPPISKGERDGETQMIRRTCINLLERVQAIAPDIKPTVRVQAKKLAMEWKGKMAYSRGENGVGALDLLQLIISYSLVSEFKVDEILDLLVIVCRKKQAVDICKSLGLTERVPDLIRKLNSRGRQLDSVKFAHAFNLVDKCPPVPLLKAYVKESKKAAQDVRKRGNNSKQSQNEAIWKELGALKSVLNAVEEYKLEAEYPRKNLEKQIAKLEQLRANRKRTAAAVATASNSKTQQPNKRPRSFATASKPAAAMHASAIQNHPPLGLADRAPYMGLAGSYNLAATGSFYSHAGQNLSETPIGQGVLRNPPRSYPHPSEALAGSSGLYEGPLKYGGYPISGLPPSYGSSLYP